MLNGLDSPFTTNLEFGDWELWESEFGFTMTKPAEPHGMFILKSISLICISADSTAFGNGVRHVKSNHFPGTVAGINKGQNMNEEQRKLVEQIKQLCDSTLAGERTYEDFIESADMAIMESPEP